MKQHHLFSHQPARMESGHQPDSGLAVVERAKQGPFIGFLFDNMSSDIIIKENVLLMYNKWARKAINASCWRTCYYKIPSRRTYDKKEHVLSCMIIISCWRTCYHEEGLENASRAAPSGANDSPVRCSTDLGSSTAQALQLGRPNVRTRLRRSPGGVDGERVTGEERFWVML